MLREQRQPSFGPKGSTNFEWTARKRRNGRESSSAPPPDARKSSIRRRDLSEVVLPHVVDHQDPGHLRIVEW